jgi:hypothetical protein
MPGASSGSPELAGARMPRAGKAAATRHPAQIAVWCAVITPTLRLLGQPAEPFRCHWTGRRAICLCVADRTKTSASAAGRSCVGLFACRAAAVCGHPRAPRAGAVPEDQERHVSRRLGEPDPVTRMLASAADRIEPAQTGQNAALPWTIVGAVLAPGLSDQVRARAPVARSRSPFPSNAGRPA